MIDDEKYAAAIAEIERKEREAAEGEPPAYRTLADVSDDPPPPLILGMFEDGPNCAYGIGGVGKGTSGAYWVCELQRLGKLPVIYDPENRPREWARRVSGLGGDRSRVIYVQPSDLPRQLRGRPLWDVAPHLGRIIRSAGGDLLMIDSALPASGVGEERLKSDAQLPYLYVESLDALGAPSVTFGHTPKGQPEGDPYGSVSWVNAMRLTWLATRAEGQGHRIRWRPRKRNERGHIPGVILVVEYGEDGRPRLVTRLDDEKTTKQWLLAVLDTEPRAVADLVEEWLEEDLERDAAPSHDEVERVAARMRQTLLRLHNEGLVRRDGKGRKTRWYKPEPERIKLVAEWPK